MALFRKKEEQASRTCWTCTGTGRETVWLSVKGRTEKFEITCTECGGSGEK